MNNLKNFIIVLTTLFLFLTGLRFAFPTADPPSISSIGTPWIDEGSWVHNARNKVLFGEWRIDDWNPVFTSLTFTGFEYLIFKLFGIGTFQARLVSMVLGCLTLFLFYSAIRKGYDEKVGIVALLLLGTNYIFLMYNKIAILETTLIFFMVLTLYFFQKGWTKSYYFIFSGMSCILVFLSKASGVFFVVASFLTLLTILIQNFKSNYSARSIAIRAILLFSLGFAITLIILTIFWILPNFAEYKFYNFELYAKTRVIDTIEGLFFNMAVFPIAHSFFGRMYIVTIFTSLGLLTALIQLKMDFKQIDKLNVFFFYWFILGVVQLFASDIYSQRRYIYLIPAMIGIGSWIMLRADELKVLVKLNKTNTVYKIVTLFILIYILYSLYGSIGHFFFNRFRINIIFSSFFAILSGLIIFKKIDSIIRKTERCNLTKRFIAVLITLSLTINLGQYIKWAVNRSYTTYNASKQLDDIFKTSMFVQGNAAISLCLENRIKPLFIACHSNYKDMLERDDVKYILAYSAKNPPTTDIVDILTAYKNEDNMRRLILAYPKATIIAEFELYDFLPDMNWKSVVLLQKN